ncbi:MAG: hypothetical protein IKA17_09235 [Clostridia bacterium]|nr:hypothetical protein [Clostridia bacterium]
MKKRITIFALVLALIISSLPSLAMAADVQVIDLKDMLSDKEGWSILNDGNTTFKDGALSNISKNDEAGKPVTELFGYTKEKYTDVIYDFDIVMDFKTIDKWQGFLVRSTEPLNVPWSKNYNYLIVITGEQIELQRFGYKHAFLGVSPTPFKSGERVNVRYGAINQEDGVRLFLAINGKTIFDIVDEADSAIREGGYFGVYNQGSTLEIYPSSRVGEIDTPSANKTSISTDGLIGDSVNIDYTYSDIYGSTEGETEYTWYRTLANIDHFGTSMAFTNEAREKYLEKIEGATGRTYTITNSDVGFNIKCGIKAKSKETGLLGEEVITNSVYIDTVSNMLGNGLFFVKGSRFAVLNGEKKELNTNEIPFTKFGKLYVPAQFSANALGYNMTENGDSVVFSKDGTQVTVLSENIIKAENGTIFVNLESLKDVTGIAATYEALYGIGMVNDLCAQLNPIEYAEILRNIRSGITD